MSLARHRLYLDGFDGRWDTERAGQTTPSVRRDVTRHAGLRRRCAGVANGQTTFDEYVAWYSWARASLAGDANVCHAAAAAGTQARAMGGGRRAAAVAANSAARYEETLRQTRASYGYRHRDVEWFIRVGADQGVTDERCHEAAQAALESIAAGGNEQSAAEPPGSLRLPTRPHK
jgi:hypothetical protein